VKLSITDLNIAMQEKDEAKRNYIAALRDLWKSYYRLRRLTLYDFEKDRPIYWE
jgi:outer membrane protein